MRLNNLRIFLIQDYLKFRRQTCVAQDYPSLKTDFIDSIYVVSKKDDYNEHLETKFADNEMFKNCKPRGPVDEEYFKFTVDEW